jgi:uncharacterized membrane protein YhaH (DUF805 family)
MAVKLTDNRFLFRPEGRINCLKYGCALFANLIFCLVCMTAVAFAVGRILGAGVKSVDVNFLVLFGFPPAFPFNISFDLADPPSTATLGPILLHAAETPLAIFSLWFLAATTIKRLHDRDKSGWWIVAFLIAPPLLRGIADRFDEWSVVAVVFSLAAMVLTVWGFVELLFLRGTSGPNRFGPDPRAPVGPVIPSAPAAPRWEQPSELEFIPHSAGPSPGPHVMRGHD